MEIVSRVTSALAGSTPSVADTMANTTEFGINMSSTSLEMVAEAANVDRQDIVDQTARTARNLSDLPGSIKQKMSRVFYKAVLCVSLLGSYAANNYEACNSAMGYINNLYS